MRLSEAGLAVIHDGTFTDLSYLPNTAGVLSFLAEERLLAKVGGPIITTADIAQRLHEGGLSRFGVAVAHDAQEVFWKLHRGLMRTGFYPRHRDNVELGRDVEIGPGAAIGGEGFEVYKHERIPHAGWVKIGDRVTIGANTCVDRSVWRRPTEIGDDTHVDNLVHIAHNVRIGRRCRIVAGTVIGGSAVIEDDVFLGIGARVRPGVRIGHGSFIGMSVTVTRDVSAGSRVVITQ